MVLQFVGFMAGWNRPPDGMPPLASGVLGGLVTTWATFLPCFLFIFLGAPYIEVLRGNAKLAAALTGITAAVVGVIANLAVVFGLAVLFPRGFARRPGSLRRRRRGGGSDPSDPMAPIGPMARAGGSPRRRAPRSRRLDVGPVVKSTANFWRTRAALGPSASRWPRVGSEFPSGLRGGP